MVINSYKPFWQLLREALVYLIPIFLYVLVIGALDLQFHLERYNFPVALITVIGTFIGLLLAFRTNSSYDRWWEGRILWGKIVNDSRTWVRQLVEFSKNSDSSPTSDTIRRMALRQAAWCYALSRSLRDQQPVLDLMTLLDPSEIESYLASHNVPNSILLNQAKELRGLYDQNQLELFQFVELEKTLTRLTDSMGGCERIKNTVFPTSYSRLILTLIYVFAIFLPFGLFNVPAGGLVATCLLLSVTFLLIDRVSIYLQDPFSNRPSDTPTLSLSRTIEINIKQMLGDEDLPAKMEPIDGVLY